MPEFQENCPERFKPLMKSLADLDNAVGGGFMGFGIVTQQNGDNIEFFAFGSFLEGMIPGLFKCALDCFGKFQPTEDGLYDNVAWGHMPKDDFGELLKTGKAMYESIQKTRKETE